VIRWLGGEAEARRARKWQNSSKISFVLLYALAIAGMVIVWLVVGAACRPVEPPLTNLPSQHHIVELDEPCRCEDRSALDDIPTEDPRFIP
jgi:hypothetical protein